MGLFSKAKDLVQKEIVLVIDKKPKNFLTRAEFEEVQIGDYIHRFTGFEPHSRGERSYNGTRKVVNIDRVQKIITLVDLSPNRFKSTINYSGKEFHGMRENGETTRGSESFEGVYKERYTKTSK